MAHSIRFLTGAALLILSIGAFAQSSNDLPALPEEEAKVLAPIEVTGYHIKRMDIEGPAPVLVVTGEELELAGINTVEQFANYLTINRPIPVGYIGTSFDLRGIGIDTTLVLINGYRVAPYAQDAENAVDVDTIPVSAIERIEILKDGASAIYGADAIAGVVNIILRTGYDGIEVSAGYGDSQHGGGRETMADIVMGKDTGRGSIMFSLSWYDVENQGYWERDWSDDLDFSSVGGPNYRDTRSSPPTFLRYDNFMWEADPECGADPKSSSVGPSHWGAEWGTACRYNWAQYQDLYPGFQRLGASLSGRYEFGANLSLFGDAFYNEIDGTVHQAPVPVYPEPEFLGYFGNPYVPAQNPGNPFGTDGEIRSRLLDLGNRSNEQSSESYRVLLGLEGLWGDWDWRLSGLASGGKTSLTSRNQVILERYQSALLGLGGPGGDQWYNPFGAGPQNDPDLIDWLRADSKWRAESGEYSLDLRFSRWFGNLPGGPAGVAVGAQYREQDLEQWADELSLSGALGPTPTAIEADRDILSAYIEFSLPLLDDLEAQLAVRYEDYSDFGDTTNPKVALRWQPLEQLMFRGSWSTSFKPPSFYELYYPEERYTGGYRDTARCEYTGAPEDCERREYPAIGSGNPELGPEEGESWFLGTVWTPAGVLEGFELQLDFWKFRHEDRVEWLGGQTVLDAGGSFGIVRAPTEPDGTPGRIIEVQETYINSDVLETRGFDTTLRYHWRSGRAGTFRASLMHTYIDEWVFTETMPGDFFLNRNIAGHWWGTAVPRNRANINLSWDRGAHGAAANIRYTGNYYEPEYEWVDGEPTDEFWRTGSHTTLDLQYRYRFESLRGATLRLGCRNALDEDPPVYMNNTNEPMHDGRGRFFYIRWQQPIRF